MCMVYERCPSCHSLVWLKNHSSTSDGDENDLQELSKHLEGLDVVKRNVRPQMIRNVGGD